MLGIRFIVQIFFPSLLWWLSLNPLMWGKNETTVCKILRRNCLQNGKNGIGAVLSREVFGLVTW